MMEDKIVDKDNVSIVERYKVIDVIKGYGICLMVCGHSGAPFTDWIYLFHMALFFIASGYLWNERNAVTKKNVVQYVKRKAKSLWLPFVLINLFFTVTQNFFLKIGIYSTDAGASVLPVTPLDTSAAIKKVLGNIIFSGGSQLAGATWFLRSLFCITIVNAVITYLLKNIISKKTYVFIAMVVAAIGMQLVNNNVGSISLLVEKIGLQSFFAGYFAYLIGMILKKTTYMQFVEQHTLSCFLLSGGGLLLLNFIGKIQLNVGHVENVAFFALSSLLGWILVYIVSINSKWIASCVEYIGKHSVWILGLHFLSFKIVTMVYLKIVPESKATLAAYPVVYENNILWIAYTLAGIIAPLLVGYIWHKLFSFLKSMEIYRNNV